jgi:branched-subunit amino acid transport protein
MMLWLTIVLMGLVTFGLRLAPFVLLERLALPTWLLRALRHVPPAVLAALIAPELLLADGALALEPLNARLIAGLVAALIAWRARSVLLTIAAGMAVLWVLQAIGW